jgi:ATP-dependent helicase/nuclease subunit A
MPGRVDLWPPVPKPDKAQDERHWTDPVDATDPPRREPPLAERVAEAVRDMLENGSLPVEVDGIWMRRPVTPAT